jgi:hypothetical protein
MRGKFLHNKVIIAALLLALSALGYQVLVEHPVRPGQRPPCVDMFVIVRDKRIVLEAERSTARLGKDLAKAHALAADLLLIIVPHSRLRARMTSALERLVGPGRYAAPVVQVLTLGTALRWVSNNCPAGAPRPAASGTRDLSQSPLRTKARTDL